MMRMRLRGRYLPALLEQQWSGRTTLLYTSGLHYRHDGGRVTEVSDGRGRPIDPDRVYTVAANELIATGARFSVLRDHGLGKQPVGTDVQALVSYLERHQSACAETGRQSLARLLNPLQTCAGVGGQRVA